MGVEMKETLLLPFYVVLALALLFFGFFIVYEGGEAAVGSAIVMWMLSGVVVVSLIVPKFVSRIEKKDEAKHHLK